MKINFKQAAGLRINKVWGPAENRIHSVKYNSKNVLDQSAFFCINGKEQNGHAFIKEALVNGASVIVGDDATELEKWRVIHSQVTFLVVDDVKTAMARLSALFYEDVFRKMTSIAVTGTNGKTTVTSYIRSMLNKIGITAGSIGTEGIFNDKEKIAVPPTTPTTPEAPDLHEFCHSFYKQGLHAVVMETTSIAIEQKRVEGLEFDIGVHTNLTPEHLEFHGSFSAYKQAKLKLFDRVKKAVVNLDDAGMSAELLNMFDGPLLTYSFHNPDADVMARNVKTDLNGVSFELYMQNRIFHLEAPLYGDHNVSNLMATICVCLHLKIPTDRILAAIPFLQGPEGRFQVLDGYANYRIVLDYAHTPDALEKVLETVNKVDHRQLIVMITGIGLRDPNKRPSMAKAVEGRADHIIVTVDHPGYVDRKKIVEDVLTGFSDPDAESIHVELHREEGIHKALSLAGEDDLVLLTGIGFGGYQIIEGKKEYYSEMEVIERYYVEQNQYMK